MSTVQVLPADLLAAAGPLRAAAVALRELADQRRRLLDLAGAAPSDLVRTAVGEFVRAGELAVWDLSETLLWLSEHLQQAESWYRTTEDAVARSLPVLAPRTDFPALRPAPPGESGRPAPQPQAAAAPVAP